MKISQKLLNDIATDMVDAEIKKQMKKIDFSKEVVTSLKKKLTREFVSNLIEKEIEVILSEGFQDIMLTKEISEFDRILSKAILKEVRKKLK